MRATPCPAARPRRTALWAERTLRAFSFQAQDILICTKNQLVADFLFDLRVLLQLAEMLDENSFRRAGVSIPWRRCTGRCTSPHRPWTVRPGWRACARRAPSCPRAGLPQRRQRTRAALLGHSHMDTAWLWPTAETVRKKCAHHRKPAQSDGAVPRIPLSAKRLLPHRLDAAGNILPCLSACARRWHRDGTR